MSDSLREQLQRAGFVDKTPDKPPKKKNKRSGQRAKNARSRQEQVDSKAQVAEAERQKRKTQKLAISALIDEQKIKEFAGDSAYAYTLEKKIRQLFVTDAARAKLISGEWVITRLNGVTHLVPKDTGAAILDINPKWLVVTSEDKTRDDDDYEDFPVPDDLQW
jgi:uncharacterized protein YaiL (DUF2058 family)